MRRFLLQAFHHLAIPLLWYYLIAVGVPMANGAARNGRVFTQHALIVLVLPPVLIVVGLAAREIGIRVLSGRLHIVHRDLKPTTAISENTL